MTFAEKLEFECLKRGMFAAHILRDIGLNPSNLTHWKRGNGAPEKYAFAIAMKLGITEEDLLEGVDGTPMHEGGVQYGVVNARGTLAPEEQYIIDTFRKANFLGKAQLIALSQEMNENGGELKKQ